MPLFQLLDPFGTGCPRHRHFDQHFWSLSFLETATDSTLFSSIPLAINEFELGH
jgi:hypothetical protein